MLFPHDWRWILEPSPYTGKPKWNTRQMKIARTIDPASVKQDEPYISGEGETDGDWLYNNTVWSAKPCERGKGIMGFPFTKAFPKYRIGSSYAVQPARGEPTIWWRTDMYGGIRYAHEFSVTGSAEIDSSAAKSNPKPEAWLRDMGYQPLRIVLLDVRCEDVRQISDADVEAEGFASKWQFLETWTSMHDKPVSIFQFAVSPTESHWLGGMDQDLKKRGVAWGTDDYMLPGLMSRPAERYQTWAFTFEPVKANADGS